MFRMKSSRLFCHALLVVWLTTWSTTETGALNSFAPLTSRLTIARTEFVYNTTSTLLNGVNQAWWAYGRDFGNSNYNATELEGVLYAVSEAGGNCVRMWLHCDGSVAPIVGPDGSVTAPIQAIANDLNEYLAAAQGYGVFIILSLFNFAAENGYTQIWTDEDLLQTYIVDVLYPILDQVSQWNSLAVIELSNEPEGSTAGIPNAGWNSQAMQIIDLQRSTNLLASAIHSRYPGLLVTQGSWSFQVSTDFGNFTNIYRDDRLIGAGGQPNGTLDFQSVHYYEETPGQNPFDENRWDVTDLLKPFLVGEFSSSGLNNEPIDQLYTELCYNQWSGSLGWQANGSGQDADQFNTLLEGVQAAAQAENQGKCASQSTRMRQPIDTK